MGASNGGYFVADWTPVALALAALVLPVVAVGFYGGTRSRFGSLAIGLFALYASWTFASVLWSPNRGDAWLGAAQTLFYLLAFWAAVAFVSLGASRRWVLAASVLGPAAVAAVTLVSLVPQMDDLFKDGRLVGTVGYYNGQAAFLLVPFWVAVHLASSRTVNPLLRAGVLAGAVVSLDLAVLTQSRGAMVAAAISLPVYFLFSGQRLRGLIALLPVAAALYGAFPALNGVYQAFVEARDASGALERALPIVWWSAAGAGLYGLVWGVVDRFWTPPRALSRATGAVALACAVLLIAGGSLLFVERFGGPAEVAQDRWEAFRTNDRTGQDQSRYLSASGTGRFELWQVAWEDFAENPVRGIGTHNYEATYYQLRDQNTGFVRQPHSLPLEVLAERGVVGGALFFALLAVSLAVGLRRRFGDLGAEGKAQVGALIAAVCYWFVHSGAEWFWQMPAVTLPAVLYLALLVAPWSARGAHRPATGGIPGLALRLGGAGFACLALVVISPLYLADRHLEESRRAPTPAAALASVERAQRLNPFDARLAEREAEIATEAGDWDRAEAAYKRSISLNPEHYAPQLYLGVFYERRGKLDAASLRYERALALNPLGKDVLELVERKEKTQGG